MSPLSFVSMSLSTLRNRAQRATRLLHPATKLFQITKEELYRPGLGLSIVRSGTCRALQSRRLVWRAYATTCASRSSRVSRTFRGLRIEYRLQPDRHGGQAYPAEAGTLYAVPCRTQSPTATSPIRVS